MDNILTYVKWRKDLKFNERPFNDVDALIFAILAYAEWDGIVGKKAISLQSAAQKFSQSKDRKDDAKRYAYSLEIPLLVNMLNDTRRYNDVKIMNYQTVFDKGEVVQFSGVTFVLPDHTYVIAYRGTDSSILGWKEDFKMTYLEEIPSHKYALAYLNETMPSNEKKKFFSLKNKKVKDVYIVGHSKGGNLAMYASLKAPQFHQQITRVYNFDGPGFLPSFYAKNTENLATILPKTKLYLPHASIIGRLLDHKEEAYVIEGYESGLMQHSAFKWRVHIDGFVNAQALSKQSDEYVAYIDKMLLSKTKEEKRMLIKAIFDSLEKLNIEEITDLGELNLKKGFDSLKEFGQMSNEDKRFFLDCLRFLFTQTKDFIFTKTNKKL